MKHRLLSCAVLLGLTTSLVATPIVGTRIAGHLTFGLSTSYAADLIRYPRRLSTVPGSPTPNTPSNPPGSFVPPGPSTCPSGVRYVQGEDSLWYTATEFAAAMRGDDNVVGRESLTPAQQQCTSTPPHHGFTPPLSTPPSRPSGTPQSTPPTFGGACPPAQRYVYVNDAGGYLTIAQRDEAMRTGVIPGGLQSIPASGCAPTSTPPLIHIESELVPFTPPHHGFTPRPSRPSGTPQSTPPTFGGACPPAQRYVYVNDAGGYLTIAQRDEAMRTGVIPGGLQSIPASGCAPTSTPPLIHIESELVPFTPPYIPYDGGHGGSCNGGFFPMQGDGLFDDDPDFAPMADSGGFSNDSCAPTYGGSFYASLGGGVSLLDFSTSIDNTTFDIYSAPVSGSASNSGLIGSVRAGYDHAFPTHLFDAAALTVGVFMDQTFGELSVVTGNVDPDPAFFGTISTDMDMLGSLNARAGLAFGMTLPYITAGVSWAEVDITATDVLTPMSYSWASEIALGWNIGAGIEYFFSPNWTTWTEVRYHKLEADFPGVTGVTEFTPFSVDYSTTTVQAGFTYRY